MPLIHSPVFSSIAGDIRSLPLPDGGSLWVADRAQVGEGGVGPTVFLVPSGAMSDCSGWSAQAVGPAFAPSPVAPDALVTPLDLVETSDGPALYYQLLVDDPTAPLGLLRSGIGLAPRDPTTGLFTPTRELLWSPNRPAYGGSAMRVGGMVYVYGCRDNGNLTTSCFVARADAAQAPLAGGYSYFTGAGWSMSADDAVAIVAEGGPNVAVRPDPRGSRYVMTYVPPLGLSLMVRTAPAPEGPWSGAVSLATCVLTGAGTNSFCVGGEQHTQLASPPGMFVVSYDAVTFASDASDVAPFWPRLATLPLP
jgi:hypothetical protein